jgi:hypothetical protein
MKSTEFSATNPQKHAALQENKSNTVSAKGVARKQTAPAHNDHTPYGVDDPNGYVITRMRSAKPALWAKVQNWD